MNNLNHLETKDINVWFGERHVLRDVSLQFQNNHVTALPAILALLWSLNGVRLWRRNDMNRGVEPNLFGY